MFWMILLIVLLVIFLVFVVIWVIQAHKRKVETGKEELIGRIAVVETALSPKGIVLVEGEHWAAVIDKGSAAPEEEVIITKVEGLRLTVTKK